MLNSSILHDTLKDFNYYVHKLPMFLQQSEGFTEHFRIWYDLLVGRHDDQNVTGVVGTADTLFNLLNIFGLNDEGIATDDYLDYINSLPDSNNGQASDILDNLGALFGVRRAFEATYLLNNVEQKKFLRLDNRDFLILIKSQIIKNYCNGTYEQIKQYYESVGLYVYATTSTEPATANIYLVKTADNSVYNASENVQIMFLAGLLTIQSMGISYRHAFVDLSELLIWSIAADETDEIVVDNRGWSNDEVGNGGVWLI